MILAAALIVFVLVVLPCLILWRNRRARRPQWHRTSYHRKP